jgi:peptidoglycan/xylan/chitin deacetylase (PgdA/CDA1 family)
MNAILVISVSLELIWGYINTRSDEYIALLRRDPSAGRKDVYELLNLLEEYDIPATWAVLGHLFLDQCDRINGTPHPDMPRFKKNWYNVDPCTNIHRDPLFYAKDIVERIILSKVKHEIGYHSFSHVIFSECSRQVAEAEIAKGLEIARKDYGLSLQSFIFPQNKIGHIDILRKYGFKAYRGENLWQAPCSAFPPRRLFGEIISSLKAPRAKPRWEGGILDIPTSMLFEVPRFPITPLKVKLGLLQTIHNGGVFHISMHPHLLKANSFKKQLRTSLSYVNKAREQKKLKVLTMAELASCLTTK